MVLESDGEAAHTPSQSVGRHGDLPHTHTKLVRRPHTHTKSVRRSAWVSALHTHTKSIRRPRTHTNSVRRPSVGMGICLTHTPSRSVGLSHTPSQSVGRHGDLPRTHMGRDTEICLAHTWGGTLRSASHRHQSLSVGRHVHTHGEGY